MARRSLLLKPNGDVLGRGIRQDVEDFARDVRQIARAASDEATRKSRSVFRSRLSGRPTVPPRQGRPTTQGAFADHIQWAPTGDGAQVNVLVERMEQAYGSNAARIWLIQEIGTGKAAQMAVGGEKSRGGQGRTGARTSGNVRVKSQVGRVIPGHLRWSGNNPPNDQLVKAAPIGGWQVGMRQRITKEIKGKGYVRLGGGAGFRLYEREIEKAWKAWFGHHPQS